MNKPSPHSAELKGAWMHFWFRPVSALGFGMMRIAFGATAFLVFATQLHNVSRYYGPIGIFPQNAVEHFLRASWRFSLLDYTGTFLTQTLFLLLLVSLLFVVLGLYTKRALFVSLLVMYSFHEYAQYLLDGGDTLLRLIGFILLLSPCGRAMSIENLLRRQRLAAATGKDQDPKERTMPIWPYRLLLWQMIMLYTASGLEKWSGSLWKTGSAVAVALHHAHFTRLGPWMADMLSILSPVIGYFTLISQSAWILLIIAPIFVWFGVLPKTVNGTLKRALLLTGIVIHGAIFLIMDVGAFSLVVFAAYFGLLLDDDFSMMQRRLVGGKPKPITVLFDGRCGLCNAAMIVLRSFDWFHRLTFENFHDPRAREKHVPKLTLQALNEAMHVKAADGTITRGFFAFRTLSRYLPPLWPLLVLLYVPGVALVGEKVYAWVARHRGRSKE